MNLHPLVVKILMQHHFHFISTFILLNLVCVFASSKKCNREVLKDLDNNVEDVQPISVPESEHEFDVIPSPSQEHSVVQDERQQIVVLTLSQRIFNFFFGDTNSPSQTTPQNGQLVFEGFKDLMDRGEYRQIAELGKTMGNVEFLKHLCPVMESIEHFEGLYECLDKRGIVPDFLAYGDMGLVKTVIVTYDKFDSQYCINTHWLYDALNMSFKQDQQKHTISLLEAIHLRAANKDKLYRLKRERPEFERFFQDFFDYYIPEKYGTAFKRFLTLHGEELNARRPEIFETLYKKLFGYLIGCSGDPNVEKFMKEFVGQPSLITSIVFTKLCLVHNNGYRSPIFIDYAWRESIEKGLKLGDESDRKSLWGALIKARKIDNFNHFPSSHEEQILALSFFKTKEEMEKEWFDSNILEFQKKLLAKLGNHAYDILLKDLWRIVSEYAITWVFY